MLPILCVGEHPDQSINMYRRMYDYVFLKKNLDS